jgi:hypothetical protein
MQLRRLGAPGGTRTKRPISVGFQRLAIRRPLIDHQSAIVGAPLLRVGPSPRIPGERAAGTLAAVTQLREEDGGRTRTAQALSDCARL